MIHNLYAIEESCEDFPYEWRLLNEKPATSRKQALAIMRERSKMYPCMRYRVSRFTRTSGPMIVTGKMFREKQERDGEDCKKGYAAIVHHTQENIMPTTADTPKQSISQFDLLLKEAADTNDRAAYVAGRANDVAAWFVGKEPETKGEEVTHAKDDCFVNEMAAKLTSIGSYIAEIEKHLSRLAG